MTEKSGTATYLAYAAGKAKKERRGGEGNSKSSRIKGAVEWTEGPGHLSTLLRREMARERELVRHRVCFGG